MSTSFERLGGLGFGVGGVCSGGDDTTISAIEVLGVTADGIGMGFIYKNNILYKD